MQSWATSLPVVSSPPRDRAYEIVGYRSEHREQILRLQTGLWSLDLAINAAYLQWKYEQNPYQESPLIYVATHAGEVVGMRGMHGARWRIGDTAEATDVLCAGDMVVSPAHQNRGLFRQIDDAATSDLAARGHRFIFNFSAAPVTFLRSLRAGWRLVGPHRTVARPPAALGSRHREQLGRAERTIVGESILRAKAMADLNRRLNTPPSTGGAIRHVRDREYFSWRYANPLSSYTFLYSGDDHLDGYIVLQQSAGVRAGRINILDWVATGSELMADLLTGALARAERAVLAIWSATLSETQRRLLAAAAFRHIDESQGVKHYRPGVLVCDVGRATAGHDWSIDSKRLLTLANWDLRMSNSDGF